MAGAGGVVKAINVEKGAPAFSRKVLDELSHHVTEWGVKGLMWVKVNEGGWQSPLNKFIHKGQQSAINQRVGGAPGDLLLMVADAATVVNRALGMLRLEVARRLDLLKEEDFSFVWCYCFGRYSCY